MGRLIDADECLTFLKENCSMDMYLAVRAILDPCKTVEAIPIPKGATNGDVIKVMFPNVPIDCFFEDTISFYPTLPNGVTEECHFNEDWWNAPYKENKDGKID